MAPVIRILARLSLAALVGGGLMMASSPAITRADNYLLIINANNRFSADQDLAQQEIRRLYLKEKQNWPDAEASSPIGRPTESEAHQAFLDHVLGMSQAELNDHWARLKQITGETPPREVERPRSLLRQIARDKGAFSVIGESEARKLPARVRVLFEFSVE